MKESKKQRRSRGAVTIFLTLILVPCLIFTCAFGDLSRVVLSQSQATAASDLALYSLMADYDENLKEWYGLVSSCQDIDSFYETSANYFKGMMDANGIDDFASQTLIAYLSAAQSGDLTDFLQVDGLDTVQISAVEGGAMGSNPALIEDGIVEFMKYRGPVVILENIIDRLQILNLSGDLDGLTQADQNQPIVEAKKEYAAAEGDMMDDFLHSYLAIKHYEDYRNANGVPVFDKYLHQYPEMMSQIAADYAKVTDLITKYYAATDGIANISGNFPNVPFQNSNNILQSGNRAVVFYQEGIKMVYTLTGTEFSWVGAESSIGADYDSENDNYSFSYEAMEELTKNIDYHINSIEKAANSVVDACNGITRPPSGQDVNQAVYCMRIQNAIRSEDLNTIKQSGKALMQIVAKLYLAQCWDLPYPDPLHPNPLHDKDWRREVENLIVRLESVQRNYLSYGTPNTPFETILKEYADVAPGVVNNVINRRYSMVSEYMNGSTVDIGTFIQKARQDLGAVQEHLIRQIGNIDTILNGGTVQFPEGGKTYSVPSLDQLKEKITAMCNARENWGSEANSQDSQYAREEQAEYSNPSLEGEKWIAAIAEEGPESVEILRTRLLNIRADMVTVREAITNFTYGGKEICLLTTEDAIAAAKTVIPTSVNPSSGSYISQSLSDNTNAAKGYHSQLIRGGSYTLPKLVSGEDGNDPDLHNDPPSIYDLMCRELNTERLAEAMDEKEKQEKKNEEDQNKAKEAGDKAKGYNSDYLGDLGKDPVETSGGGGFGLGTVVTGLIDSVNLILNGNFDEFRDKLYVCSYIMEMFSWSSYHNEGQFKLAQKDTGKDNLPTLKQYNTSKHGFVINGKDYTEPWKNADTTFTPNKSLTNQMIDSAHNLSCLAEVEYILYGNDTNKANLEAAYGQLFIIRETLNLLSGFQYFWDDAIINAFAAGIMAATCGLIPEAVTKVVLIGLMATMESVNDLNRLKAGTPVAIYKKKEQWCLSITRDNLTRLVEGNGIQKSDPNGFFYSDYMLLFLLISCQDAGLYKSMLLRVGDLIEGNVQTMGGEDGFDLEASHVYFQLTGELRVKPLLLELPIVTSYKGADASKVLKSTGWCSYSLNVIRGYS